MPDAEFTTDELMIVNAARRLGDLAASGHRVCFVGIGLPSTAANLARRLYDPAPVLVYESGCIGAKPTRLPLSIGDGELGETADAVVSVPEIFAYWLQAGRIDVGFLGGAQLDRFANINSTVIGNYEQPVHATPRCRRGSRDRRIGRGSDGDHAPGRDEHSSIAVTSARRSVSVTAPAIASDSDCGVRGHGGSSPTSVCSSPTLRPASCG